MLLSFLVATLIQFVEAKSPAPNLGTQLSSGTFKDADKGFSIELPRGWEQQTNVMGASVISVLPLRESKDKDFQANINVVVENLPQKMNSQEYFDASQRIIEKVFQDYKLERKGDYKNAGVDFKFSQFTHRLGPIKVKVRQYITVQNKKAYIITTTTTDKSFSNFVPTFEKSVLSFKIDTSRKISNR